MEYDRDLNACINIARRVMRSAGWGSCEPPGPADEGRGVKPSLNAGSSRLKSWNSSLTGFLSCFRTFQSPFSGDMDC